MGIFGFLKKKVEVVELEEQDLKPYFEKAVNARYSKLNARIHELSVETKYHVRKIKEYLDQLEKEDLQNPNVLPKEYHMMQGNRTNYIKRYRIFMDSIRIPQSYFEINEQCNRFFSELEKVSQDTQRNYFVLKEFFANTLHRIAKKLKETESLFIKLKELLDKENIDIIDETNSLFKQLEDSRMNLEKYRDERQSLISEMKIIKAEIDKIDKKINRLHESNDYRFYKQFLEERTKLAQKETDIKKKIHSLFAELERPLKKYSKGTSKTVQAYLKDPVNALVNDSRLTIATTLKKIGKDVDKGSIELKAKQKDKVLEIIDSNDKEKLSDLKSSLEKVVKEKKDNEDKIRKNTTSLQLREQESYKEKAHQELKEQKDRLEVTDSKIESTNPNLILQKITKKLGELSGHTVKWKR